MRSPILAVVTAITLCTPALGFAAHQGSGEGDAGHAVSVSIAEGPGVSIKADADVSISSDAEVPKGKVHGEDIVSISGNVRIEGKVSGDVVVIFGNLDLQGAVDGAVVLIMSRGRIGEDAEIGGDLVNVAGTLDRSPAARVGGEVVDISMGQLAEPFSKGLTGLVRCFYVLVLVKLFLLFLTLVLVTALVPRRVLVIASAFPRRWGAAILTGIIAYCAAFMVFFVLALLVFVVIGIPLIPAFAVALYVVICMGLAGMLHLVGHAIGRNLFKRDLGPFPAVLGGFVVYAVASLIPLFSYVFFFLLSPIISSVALGIALLTRFGSEEGWRRSTPGSPGAGFAAPSQAPPAPPIITGA